MIRYALLALGDFLFWAVLLSACFIAAMRILAYLWDTD